MEILGLSGVPSAGDTLLAVGDERKARQIALARQERELEGWRRVARSTDAIEGRVRGPLRLDVAMRRQSATDERIASLADRHFTIVKDTSADTALTTVTRLERSDLVAELVRMLGAEDGDPAARRHARELLKAA